MPRSARPKARTKTFTGCWTCRLRRLKCDEVTPQCNVCVDKGIECGGYDARLQWLPPNYEVYTKTSSKGEAQRRRLLPATSVLRLTDEELETAIADIDQAGPLHTAQSRGPFSVFCIEPHAFAADAAGGDLDDADSMPMGNDDATATHSIPHSEESQSSAQFPQTPHFPSIALDPFPSPSLLAEDDTSSERTDSMDFGLSVDHRLLFRPTFLSMQVKHLMDHYSRNVLRIFSILDNKNTPWNSFHLPRALQCCSELEVSGSSTPARSALLHAMLSVSAYNLQCRHASQSQEAAARKWARVGFKYRTEALRFLKTSAGNPLVASTNSEYKELLAAMLSMVTVDVVSGDTRTCGLHLNGCESLIRARRRAGVRISAKTKALHRIFFYLRVMQDATELTCNALPRAEDPDDADFSTYLDPYEPFAADDFDSASYELIYGLPQSLLLLVHQTCSLLRKMSRADVAPSLVSACDRLEEDIVGWPVDDEVARLQRARMDGRNCLILQHHVRAFHNAVIIFFCRHVRLMNRRHLQQYVHAVIHHLDEIETIKEKEMINAGPLLWPAFVAGEQAMQDATRDQFMRWFAVIEQHGVATAKLTRASLEDIWLRSTPRDPPLVPVGVLHTQLMLT